MDHLIVAEEEKYISKEDLNNYKIEMEDCLAVLNGFINYLGRAKQNKVNEPEIGYPNTDND